MGIMNKMTTVALKDLDWRVDSYGFNATGLPDDCKIGTSHSDVIAKVSGFDLTWSWALSADNTYSISTRKIWIRADRFNRDVPAFVQYLEDVNAVLTYETIDSVEEKIVNSMKTKATPTWTYSNDYAYIILNDRKPGANVAYAWNKPLPANMRFYFNTANFGCVLSFPHAYYPSRDAVNAVMADKVLTYQLNTDITEEII